MRIDITIQIPRLHAEVIADLVRKTPRENLPEFIDYETLCEFTEAVENANRLEKSIYHSGLRQFGMQSLRNDETKTFGITSDIARELAYFMEDYKRKAS